MKLSIIIVNYNTKKDLKGCLQSIFRSLNKSKLTYEIFVVDNASRDGSQSMVKEEFPAVKLIENRDDLGFCRANNQVIKIAKGEYVLLLNPDTIVLEEPFDLMVDFMKKNKETGILAPKLLDIKGETWISFGRTPSPTTVFLSFCVPDIFRSSKIKNFISKSSSKKFLGAEVNSYFFDKDLKSPKEVGFASGACLLLRKRMIEKVGLLDERFFLGSDDSDLCFRAKKEGWKIIYFPTAKIVHYAGGTVGSQNAPFYFCHRVQSAYHYFKKNYNKKTAFEVKLLLLAGLIIKMPKIISYHFLKNKNKNYNLLELYWTTLKGVFLGKTL